ncbi:MULTISPECIES: peptide deformylase [unclassified Legionella]|uniref:peptide deformylase n=1 Tax=unclassified Legionella TaxID=2622702 RepID=UPI0010551D00|nr:MULTISPECIES: peptide deformylase [unclassified Legionella]MDI9817948.1 peptide deformylase [Legionella sp. PL877]
MEKNKIILLGNPFLRQRSQPILEEEFGTPELKQLEQELFEMMQAENGLGLAAPQIGISKRAIVFGMEKHPVHTFLPAIPFTVLFNPSYEPISAECVEDYEGCLSVGALRGKVSRYKHIRYRGYNVNGQLIEREVSDLHARVLQHEYDHLEGVIFLDKVTDVNSLGFHDELVRSGKLKARKDA